MPFSLAGPGFWSGTTGKLGLNGIGAWVVHGLLAGQAGLCMVHGVWHRCMAVHATSCMGGVPVLLHDNE